MTRRKKKIIIVIAGTGVLVLGLGLYAWYARAAARFERIALYATTLTDFVTADHPIPETLDALIEQYNALENRHERIEPRPDLPSIVYRPAWHLDGGPYVVFFEQCTRWYDHDPWVVFAYPNGLVAFIGQQSRDELASILATDDKLRETGRRDSTPAPTTQVSEPTPVESGHE